MLRLEELLTAGGIPAFLEHLRQHSVCQGDLGMKSRLRTVGRIGSPAVPFLARALEDESVVVAGTAALALATIGPAASIALPALERRLRAGNDDVQWMMGIALGKIGPASSVLPPLLQVLRQAESASVAAGAVMGLLELGPPGEAALIEAVQDGADTQHGSHTLEALHLANYLLYEVSDALELRSKELPPALKALISR